MKKVLLSLVLGLICLVMFPQAASAQQAFTTLTGYIYNHSIDSAGCVSIGTSVTVAISYSDSSDNPHAVFCTGYVDYKEQIYGSWESHFTCNWGIPDDFGELGLSIVTVVSGWHLDVAGSTGNSGGQELSLTKVTPIPHGDG